GSMVSLMISPSRQAKPGVSGQPRIHRYSDSPTSQREASYDWPWGYGVFDFPYGRATDFRKTDGMKMGIK
ncbi:hypothetical protein ACFVYC_20275, partial [Pseudarthrobacter sp. NPDC058329]|uniref:hypothetical protein n=1 Tax=Pseudarthrobacter sp. NPDC058329 TaxID=3346448 RepID=UPI0036DB734D